MLSDAAARELAGQFVAGWAEEARNDMLGVIESFDVDHDDAELVMSWVDRARVTVTFGDEVD